jgi:hypothetical protein
VLEAARTYARQLLFVYAVATFERCAEYEGRRKVSQTKGRSQVGH